MTWAIVAALVLSGAPAQPPLDVTTFGAVGDGIVDDTGAFARAAASGRDLLIPRPRAHYKLTRSVRITSSVVGSGMPEIRMYGATGKETSSILQVLDYRGPGLSIRGLHLNGQWDGVGTAGEWSHLIVVKGSRNVTIEDNVLERPYGDCILLGGEGNPRPSENVVIRGNRMTGPRRCAVALIAARDVRIEHNVIRKESPYVSAIDLEPNPFAGESVQGVVISQNELDVPGGIAIQLYSDPRNRQVSRDVTVSSNTARARRFLLKQDKTGTWEKLRITGNTFRGDPSDPGRGHVSFVEVQQDPKWAPSTVSDVRVEDNVIADAIKPRQSYRDYFRGVQGLRVTGNRWQGDRRYRLQVVECPGATIAGNDPEALPR